MSATADDGRTVLDLKGVYEAIADGASNAKIYVGGYPKLFGVNTQYYRQVSQAPSGYVCDLTAFVTLDYADAQWLNQVADDLNAAIENAVNAAKANGKNVTFVPSGLFATHGLCDKNEPWFNPVEPGSGFPPEPLPESLHPNPAGYSIGYGGAFVALMS